MIAERANVILRDDIASIMVATQALLAGPSALPHLGVGRVCIARMPNDRLRCWPEDHAMVEAGMAELLVDPIETS